MNETQTNDLVFLEEFVLALETMAFISPLPASDGAPMPENARFIEMEFACPQYGAVRLVAGQSFGILLCANQLATDPSAPEAIDGADDALRELMNITCGAIIRRLGLATDQRLHMSLPTIQPLDDHERWNSFIAMPGVQLLEADGQIIAFQAVLSE
jgi:hypothetical protein